MLRPLPHLRPAITYQPQVQAQASGLRTQTVGTTTTLATRSSIPFSWSKRNSQGLYPSIHTRTASSPSVSVKVRSDKDWVITFKSKASIVPALFVGNFVGSSLTASLPSRNGTIRTRHGGTTPPHPNSTHDQTGQDTSLRVGHSATPAQLDPRNIFPSRNRHICHWVAYT